MRATSPIERRLRAISGTAVALIALAALWQLRPARPQLPASSSEPLTLVELEDIGTVLLWLALVVIALVVLARSLRAGSPPAAQTVEGLDRLVLDWRVATSRATSRAAGRSSLLDRPPPDRPRANRAGTYVPLWARPQLTVTKATEPSAATATMPAPAAVTTIAADALPARVLLLGPPVVPGARRRRTRASADELIAYLALHPEGAGRDQILEALWPGDDPGRSEKRFWQAASDARQLLDGGILRERNRYLLDREQVSTDIDELDRLLEQARTAGDELAELEQLERALGLFRGEPLEGSDYVWAEGPVRRLRATFLDLLERVGRGHLHGGNARDALIMAERGIAADALNEGFWRLALEAEGALGLRESVSERYEHLYRLLDERLGLQPDRQTREIHRRLLGQAD